METLRAVIVDDEWHARENLKMIVQEHCPNIDVVGTADNAPSGIELIQQEKPDLAFLDIRMPSGAEGFEMLTQIPDKRFQVIFVTAFKGFAIDALKQQHIQYLLKPINFQELIRVEQEIREKLAGLSDHPEGWTEYNAALNRLSQGLANV